MDGVFYLATPNGLEPSTSSVTGWRANRLHHRAVLLGTWLIIANILQMSSTNFNFFQKIFAPHKGVRKSEIRLPG